MPFDYKLNYDDRFGDKLDFDHDLAKRWAPVFIQFTSIDPLEPQLGYSGDYLSRVDYDGDWKTDNNWDNLDKFKDTLDAHVYYWGYTHDEFTILGYMTYHPRDWANSFIGLEHENDAEGVFILLESINETDYTPILISTLAHNSLNHYYLDGSEIERTSDIDQSFRLDPITQSPVVFIESMGHGVYGSSHQLDETSSSIQYTVADSSGYTTSDEGNGTVAYSLLPIAQLWDLRYNENVFFRSGFFNSDNSGSCTTRTVYLNFCQSKRASPPWLWDQNQHYPGQLWYEPLNYYGSIINLDIK